MTEDRRLTGVRIPRHVNLDSPEASARIQRLVAHVRERYPDAGTPQADARVLQQVREQQRLREEGFSEQDRRDLLEWLERLDLP